jgi:hypothetical protein
MIFHKTLTKGFAKCWEVRTTIHVGVKLLLNKQGYSEQMERDNTWKMSNVNSMQLKAFTMLKEFDEDETQV